ncbi:MAG: hypothetical protein J6Z36_02260 [Clostridia bacterium]|nr:hypothetical protein [Clostridia bacterium]
MDNVFKLKFNKKIVVAAYAGVLLCVAGFGLNIWRFIANGGFTDAYSVLQYSIIALVTLFAPVLLLCVVYNSKYIVEEREFITSFGFIKSKFKIADMTSIVYNKKENKLAIYTGEPFMVFRVDSAWAERFINL